MKISIITSVYNSRESLEDCIRSVIGQSYKNIEYIIIDGGSTDGTLDIIKKYDNKISKWISEPDKGIYDALNKGIKLSTGEIIGFLHSDDLYENDKVIEKVADLFVRQNCDCVYGDLVYVDKKNLNKIKRYWKAGRFNYNSLKKGWMPPHTASFIKRSLYEKHGSFNTKLKIAADYELFLRIFGRNNISTAYLPEVLVKMREGGSSNKNIYSIMKKSYEDYLALKMNEIPHPSLALFMKNITKFSQLLHAESYLSKIMASLKSLS